jgi:peroxiredoxin
MMISSADSEGLFSRRFVQNFLPIPATNQFAIGSLVPPFTLPDVQGDRPFRLLDCVRTRAQPHPPIACQGVLLAFTRIFTERHYCPLCYPHIQALNQAYDAIHQRGIQVLMITSTNYSQSKVVARDLGLKMPLLSDPACRVFRAYQVGQALGAPLPAQFLIDRDGYLRFRHLFSFLEANASVEQTFGAIDALINGFA